MERVQEGRNVCSEVGACAARSDRVQRGWSVCSEVGACAARLERVQRGLRDFSKNKNHKSAVSPRYRYKSILECVFPNTRLLVDVQLYTHKLF